MLSGSHLQYTGKVLTWPSKARKSMGPGQGFLIRVLLFYQSIVCIGFYVSNQQDIEIAPRLTIAELLKAKDLMSDGQRAPPAFVVHPEREYVLAGQLNYRSLHPIEPSNQIHCGIPVLVSVWLKYDECFKCVNAEEARDLIGFIDICEKFKVDWRRILES